MEKGYEVEFIIGTNAESDVCIGTIKAVEDLRVVPYKFGWDISGFGGYARTRNVMVTRFLQMKLAPYFIVVDRDIVFSRQAIDYLLEDMKNGYDLVGGCYVVKDGSHLASCAAGDGKIPIDSTLVEVKWLSTGFGAFSRNLLESMVDKLALPLMHKGTAFESYPFFEDHVMYDSERGYLWASEDYDFSDKARRIGVIPYLDTRIWADHIGMKRWKVEECFIKELGSLKSRQD